MKTVDFFIPKSFQVHFSEDDWLITYKNLYKSIKTTHIKGCYKSTNQVLCTPQRYIAKVSRFYQHHSRSKWIFLVFDFIWMFYNLELLSKHFFIKGKTIKKIGNFKINLRLHPRRIWIRSLVVSYYFIVCAHKILLYFMLFLSYFWLQVSEHTYIFNFLVLITFKFQVRIR